MCVVGAEGGFLTIMVVGCVSTENFSKHEMGNTILDVVLEAGDLLYFPRGTIHQVCWGGGGGRGGGGGGGGGKGWMDVCSRLD